MRKKFVKCCQKSILCKIALVAKFLFLSRNVLLAGNIPAKVDNGKGTSASDLNRSIFFVFHPYVLDVVLS